MKLDEFLGAYFSNNALKRILKDMGLKVGGTKNELIKRIVREGVHDIEIMLQYLYKDDLKLICESNDLWISGTNDVLIDRIVENIKIEKPERKKKKETVKESEIAKIERQKQTFKVFSPPDKKELKREPKKEGKTIKMLQILVYFLFLTIAILVDILIYKLQLLETNILAAIITIEGTIFCGSAIISLVFLKKAK